MKKNFMCFLLSHVPRVSQSSSPSPDSPPRPPSFPSHPSPTKQTTQAVYQHPDELWQKAKGVDGTHRDWYQGAVQYWDQQEASYDGVLGGFGFVSDMDINDSATLLQRVRRRKGRGRGRQGCKQRSCLWCMCMSPVAGCLLLQLFWTAVGRTHESFCLAPPQAPHPCGALC